MQRMNGHRFEYDTHRGASICVYCMGNQQEVESADCPVPGIVKSQVDRKIDNVNKSEDILPK